MMVVVIGQLKSKKDKLINFPGYPIIPNYLSAQLEDGQTNGDDEREEGQLQGVPGLQTEHTESHWHQCHRFQQNENQDWDEDFLQFRFFASFFGRLEGHLDVQFVVGDVAWRDGHFGAGHWQFDGDIVTLEVVFKGFDNVGG
jgi:hypothetical protein